MHGVCISDHGEKVTWSGYWEERQRKLETQQVDTQLFGSVANCLGTEAEGTAVQSDLFRNCFIYFDGRVDVGGGLSAYALGKVARLHGANLCPRLAKRQVTHVVCSQLSGAKERHALRDATSALACGQYIVHPTWITESVAAKRRLQERHFSLMARISQGFGLSTLDAKPSRKMQRTAVQRLEHVQRVDLTGSEVSVDVVVSNSPMADAFSQSSSIVAATVLDSEDESQETELDSDAAE